ncbi:hypothetical protein BHE74_00056644 [Ensete ventricosum]|nr:hypothetical protein BHE74_00056644 [Ensete ventricosum]
MRSRGQGRGEWVLHLYYDAIESRRRRGATEAEVVIDPRVGPVGNLPGVCRELTEGIESLPGWHKGVRWKKTKTRQKIIMRSRKACREFNHEGEKELQTRYGPKIKLRYRAKVWMMRWELAESSLGLR